MRALTAFLLLAVLVLGLAGSILAEALNALAASLAFAVLG